MRDRWAALINLPPPKEEHLSILLQSLGVSVCSGNWEQPSATPPGGSPALALLPLEEYARNCSRQAWFVSGGEPPLTCLLRSATQEAQTLLFQLDHDLFNVIPDGLYQDGPCLVRTLRGLLSPELMFDILQFAAEGAQVRRFPVSTLGEKHEVADEVAALAHSWAVAQRRTRDLHLIVNELINNAFFHSFRNSDGAEKYSARQFEQLEPGESVAVEVALSDDSIALAVEDNSGTISPREVLRYMVRQTTGEGLYDSHGRGFFLMSNLTDHLGVCVAPGRRTRIVTVMHAGSVPPVGSLNFFVAR